MTANIHDKKVNRRERCKNSRQIAYVCGCNVRMVNYVMNGERGNKRVTGLAMKIQLASMLLVEKQKLAMEEVKNMISSSVFQDGCVTDGKLAGTRSRMNSRKINERINLAALAAIEKKEAGLQVL